MVSRVTDEYKRMALAGCVLVSEPAFWAGVRPIGRGGLSRLFPPVGRVCGKRAAAYGIAHYSWLCINAKEAENVDLSPARRSR
jgi:uncharacterized protein